MSVLIGIITQRLIRWDGYEAHASRPNSTVRSIYHIAYKIRETMKMHIYILQNVHW